MSNNKDEFNRQSLITLKKKNSDILQTNPGFFDTQTMSDYGYQTFDIKTESGINYLTVDREIVRNNLRIELDTAIYELDEKSRITKLTGKIKKKVRSILPIKE